MKNKTLNNLLILVISFFLMSFTALAEGEYVNIKYGETVDVSAALGVPGKKVVSVKDVSKDGGTEVLNKNCSGTTCTVSLKENVGLWHSTAHIIVEYEGGDVRTLNLEIVDYWPIQAYLGNYSKWTYNSSEWQKDPNSNSSLYVVSKTRKNVTLPKVNNVNGDTAAGIPIVFKNFVKIEKESNIGSEGRTFVITMPVQKSGDCAVGGKVGGIEGAFGEKVDAGASVQGTGPYTYVSCYEYVDAAFLSLSGGEFKSGTMGWTYNEKIHEYMITGSKSATLPTADAISFPWGLAVNKRLVAWENQAGDRKNPGESVTTNGDTWTAIYDYDASGGASMQDRMVREGETTKIAVNGAVVSSCSSDSTKITTKVNDGVCIVTGVERTKADEVITVTVNYGSESVKYNFTVLMAASFDGEFAFEPEIKVMDIQEEELGGIDIGRGSCKTFTADEIISWGNYLIPGSSIFQGIYYAEGCGQGVQVGLCLDPGIVGPHGATYERDVTLDNVANSPGVKQTLSEAISVRRKVGSDWNTTKITSNKNLWNYFTGINTAFRIYSASEGISHKVCSDSVSGQEACRYNAAGSAFKSASSSESSLKGVLLNSHGGYSAIYNHLYSSSSETKCPNFESNYYGTSSFCTALHYLYVLKTDGAGTPSKNTDYKLVKKATYENTGTNSYVLHYSGTIQVPDGVSLKPNYGIDNSACKNFGYECDFKLGDGPDSEGKYQFTADVTVADASPSKLRVPLTEEDKANAAIKIKLGDDNNVLTDIYIIKPQVGTRQRLLFFDEGPQDLSIYLSPQDPGVCNTLSATMLETCDADAAGNVSHKPGTGAVENDSNATCNYELVKICCGIANEVDYPNLVNKVCSNNCSYNTVGAVCDFYEYGDSKVETSTLYHVREGYQYKDASNYEKNIGQCAVNVGNYATDANKSAYNIVDAAGNTMNVDQYGENQYCKVTCREEWDLTMGTFGSYMGAEAVRAGSYFAVADADIFIKGDRYCYTSYLDNRGNSQYYNNMKSFAKELINGYNAYSNASHAMSDLNQDAPSGTNKGLTDKKNIASVDSSGYSSGYFQGGSASDKLCTEWSNVDFYSCNVEDNDVVNTSCVSNLKREYKEANDGEDPSAEEVEGFRETCTEKRYYCDGYSYDYSDLYCTHTKNKIVYENVNIYNGNTYYSSVPETFVTYNYISYLQLSSKFSDGESGVGKYTAYNSNDGISTTTSKLSFDKYKMAIECHTVINRSEDESDYIECSSDAGSISKSDIEKYGEFNKNDTSATLNKKVNLAIAGTTATDASEDDTLFKDYYDYTKKQITAALRSAEATISSATSKLKAHAQMWYDCENFILYTQDYTGTIVGSDDKNNGLSNSGLNSSGFKVLGSGSNPVEVTTVFNPKVAYSYDEVVYMNLISNKASDINDNILVRNDAKNSSIVLGKTETEVKTSEMNKFFDTDNVKGSLGKSYNVNLVLRDTSGGSSNQLNLSKKDYSAYQASSPWVKDTNEFKNYEGTSGSFDLVSGSGSKWKISVCYVGIEGSDWTQGDSSAYSPLANKSDEGWKEGNCYQIGLHYYDNVNYVERSVSNSSFYKNKGNWYFGNEITIHGDTAEQAVTNYNDLVSGAGLDSSDLAPYALLGTKNVFPVSMTTPRNLYKYSYVFTNIGSFGGEKAGRLMGHENAVFKNNTRTCFYEVIESMCKCCGDGTSHTVKIEGVADDVTDRFGSTHSTSLGKVHSDPDKLNKSTYGNIGFYNTVSSLGSLAAVSESGQRDLAANWSDSSVFNYNGYNRYLTNKGYVAQKAIEAIGEEIYSPKYSAEYAYTLTPDAISDIKQNNEANEYGITYDQNHIKLYGKVLMVPTSSNKYVLSSDLDQNNKLLSEEISFGHYGSVFLEELSSKYAKPNSDDGTFVNLDLASRLDNDNVCELSEKNETSSDGSQTVKNLTNKIEKQGCRWVDYIEDDGKAISNYKASHSSCDPKTDYRCQDTFRLAFK